jgi:hypothetical protein
LGYVRRSASDVAERHRRSRIMHVVVRSYSGSGASEMLETLGQRQSEVEELISGVPGFVSYVAARTGDDTGVTVTVCEDKAGTDESSRRAAEWIKDNVSTSASPPTISEGDTILKF